MTIIYKTQKEIIDETIYPIGYKAVTENLESLRLNGTPLTQYDINAWNASDHGIWSARIPSFAIYVKSYMWQKYGIKTVIYKVALRGILEITKNGIKSSAIKFIEEYVTDKMYDVSKII